MNSILDEKKLEEYLINLGEKKYRKDQILQEIYKGVAVSFDEITNLSKDLRQKLEDDFSFESLKTYHISESEGAQTVKFLFETYDGLKIESVLMFHLKGRITLCISSQVGCAMACEFCATGKLGLSRNLEYYEIVDQYLMVSRWLRNKYTNLTNFNATNNLQIANDYESANATNNLPITNEDESTNTTNNLQIVNDFEEGHLGDVDYEPDDEQDKAGKKEKRIRNIVFMGMGEPLANKDNVFASLEILTNQKKIGLGSRHITVSTIGIIPAIRDMADKFPQVKLAISLHAPTKELRGKFMPIEKTFPLDKLMETLDEFTKKTGKRIFYEYVMLQNFNDRVEDAHDLGKLLHGKLAHVNLIPWNYVEGTPFEESTISRQRKFQDILKEYDIPSTVRANLGRDINGACGQLARKMK